MKKTFMLCLIFMFLLLGNAFAGTKTITFEWEQVISSDFAGWKLYYSTTSGSAYVLLDTITYDGVTQPVYQGNVPLTSPDGQAITYYFVLTAFDIDKNESEYSNEASALIDFEAPLVPVNLTIKVVSN